METEAEEADRNPATNILTMAAAAAAAMGRRVEMLSSKELRAEVPRVRLISQPLPSAEAVVSVADHGTTLPPPVLEVMEVEQSWSLPVRLMSAAQFRLLVQMGNVDLAAAAAAVQFFFEATRLQ